MVVYVCKKCVEPRVLAPHACWNISDFGSMCDKCETINTTSVCNRLSRYTRDEEDKKVTEKEIAELKMSLDSIN
jgi:hypothetical protein